MMEILIDRQNNYRFGAKQGFFDTGKYVEKTTSLEKELIASSQLDIKFLPLLDGSFLDFYISVRSATSGSPTSSYVIAELQDNNGNILLSKTLNSGEISFATVEFQKNKKYKIVIKNNSSSSIFVVKNLIVRAKLYERAENYFIIE